MPFTFTDVTLSAGNTLHTHAAITLTGAGFTGGTLTSQEIHQQNLELIVVVIKQVVQL